MTSAEERPLRVVVVLQDLNDTGANRVSLDRAARWQAAGDDVTVFVVMHEAAATRVPLPRGLRLRRGTAGPAQLRRALPVATAALLRVARRSDVVVVGTEVGLGLLLGCLAARATRRPLAVTVQSHAGRAVESGVARPLQALTRSVLVRADLAVCVGDGLVPTLVALGLPVERTRVVPNAVPLDAVRAAAAQPAPHREGPVVVSSGRLVPQKGFDLLLRAHAEALRRGAPAHTLVVMGEGEDRPALEALARDLGVAGSVVLAGFQANPHAVTARADLFVLSSRWEGFSLALVEALACRTPCLAFDCVAGPSQVLAGGAYGRLVPAGDVAALALAIRDHLLDQAPLRAKVDLLERAPSRLFDPDGAAAGHREVLRRLVQDAGRTGRRARLSRGRAVAAPLRP